MKSVIFAAAIASAAAFAPAQTGKATTALNAFENELGAQAPLGFYDPLNWLGDADQDRFDRLRFVELKHGRIAMLAFLGQITTRSGARLPGDIAHGIKFSDIGEGWTGSLQVPVAGALQILAFVGFLELSVMKDVTGNNAFVGDFRNGSLDFGWDKYSEQTKLKKRAVELNNGRAAMMGILGLMVHEQLGSNMPIIGQL